MPPPVKVKYQRTTKGRKSKVNLMLAAAAEDLSPVPGATSPLMMQQRGSFGPNASQMGGGYGQMGGGGAGGPFMDGGGFQHQYYGHIHEGSPANYYGDGGGQHGQQHQQQMMGMRGLPSFEQDFLRGQHHQQQQQRPFYTTAGMGGMKQHSMDSHEPDYDALHRHHVSPNATVTGVGGGGGPGGVVKGDPNNNNCDFSEMRMFNGGGGGGGGTIKSEYPGEEMPSSGGVGGSSGRMSSPMTNTNATTPDDVLEEL